MRWVDHRNDLVRKGGSVYSQNAKIEVHFRKMQGAWTSKLLRTGGFWRGMIPAMGGDVKFNGNMAVPGRTNGEGAVRSLGRSPKFHFSSGSLTLLVLPLALLGFWSATTALFKLNAPWEAAIACLIVLGLLAGVSLMEKSRARKNEALQVKLDRLIHSAESIHQSIIDLEKSWKTENLHQGESLSDWSPHGWEGNHAAAGNPTNHNGAAAHHNNNNNHHAGMVRPGRHAAGAHRITPTTKA